MAIYEYECRECGEQFEALIRGDEKAVCPACQSEELERLISMPTVHSESTHDLAMRAAKKREKSRQMEQVYTQREYEKNHDD